MASIEFIEKRVEGKKKEIAKLQAKLQRIEKAEATGWEVNPYYYCERNKRYTLRDLTEAREALAKYEEQLKEAEVKASSRNVTAILEFLAGWKQRMFDYYEKDLRAAFQEREELKALYAKVNTFHYGTPEREQAEVEYRMRREAHYCKLHGYTRETTEEERKSPRFRYVTSVKIKDGEWEYIRPYFLGDIEESLAKLNKDLDREADRKYDFIIERTIAIVGKITDASNLRVGAKGDLNGYIIGTEGTAKVQTIGAGGYNIQCFHFRTLINKF